MKKAGISLIIAFLLVSVGNIDTINVYNIIGVFFGIYSIKELINE